VTNPASVGILADLRPLPAAEEIMGTRDPRIDAYIAKSADFAKPILAHLREVVHSACPEVEETMKWSTPHFSYKGMMCGMAAFKEHCAFGFWKGSLVLGSQSGDVQSAAGQFGRITKVSDLPSKKVIAGNVKEAMRLNDEGVKAASRMKSGAKTAKAIVVPDALADALAKNRKARETFEGFSPSAKREYTEWIADAKGDDTRRRRVATAIEWMAEGKHRNWKYM
jgi:uncharacterized protein YdeI (YjbR/CyaY-like superfamily)